MDTTASTDSSPPLPLDAAERQALKSALLRMHGAGEPITVPKTMEVSALVNGAALSPGQAAALLSLMGFDATGEQIPVTSTSGSGWPETVAAFAPASAKKPLTTLQRSTFLADRYGALARSAIDDMLRDSSLEFASLEERAAEVARSFALELSKAVHQRAKHGGPAILQRCATVAQSAMLTRPR